MKPKELLEDLIETVFLMPGDRKRPPGYYIKRLSEEKRKIIQKLKSSDIQNPGWFLKWIIDKPRNILSELKEEFDKKVKRNG